MDIIKLTHNHWNKKVLNLLSNDIVKKKKANWSGWLSTKKYELREQCVKIAIKQAKKDVFDDIENISGETDEECAEQFKELKKKHKVV